MNQTEKLASLSLSDLKGLYDLYINKPSKLDENWKNFFLDLDEEALSLVKNNHISSLNINTYSEEKILKSTDSKSEAVRALRARLLIRAYRVAGHLKANLDPLGIMEEAYIPDLDPKTYGLSQSDYDETIIADGVFGLERAKLSVLIEKLKQTYCGNIGIQFMHIQDKEQRDWIMQNLENINPEDLVSSLYLSNVVEALTPLASLGALKSSLILSDSTPFPKE